MAANNSINLGLGGHLNHCILVFADILNSAFGLHLQIGGEGPVAKSESAANSVEIEVQIQDDIVKPAAHPFQKPVKPCQAIELMSVKHKVALAIHADMNGPLADPDLAKTYSHKSLKKLVMVSIEERHLGLFAIFAKKLLNQDVVGLQPAPTVLELPTVNKITHDIDVLGFVFTQKLEKRFDLGVL